MAVPMMSASPPSKNMIFRFIQKFGGVDDKGNKELAQYYEFNDATSKTRFVMTVRDPPEKSLPNSNISDRIAPFQASY